MTQFLGKYRGKVVDDRDPDHLGRVKVEVPEVYGEKTPEELPWATPCVPYAGKDIGFFTIPPKGANIWVEFEKGESDKPIWSGCFWGKDELPQNAQVKEPHKVQVFRTKGITCTLSNLGENKGVTLEVESPVVQNPLKLIFNGEGIEMNNNQKTIVKIKGDVIEIKNGEKSTITITADSIQIKEQPNELKLTSKNIELTSTPAVAKFASSGGIELQHGGATIKLATVSVNINNGALEVI